ncbi:hypothetical protein NLM33_41370 [Bradyrhizobium sp. CCGUVB1N3]|uniref:hypothetical protein n=1 Tax=Bradyrhizobium sp. CCGUVB1N3 TaxID=2949629 RepID=UPI0020B255C7|nr:hypothetical protein [Bradyrhizobium sp. CCGUVB1N3]MCP3476631.1 hypothetical protein [Bradyrhizobium sp. CCGUVB1N3]
MSVLSGHPEDPRKVNDLAMAAHATVNLAMGLVAGARAGLHVWRGRGNAEAYRTGFRGERSALSPALAMAGTPTVPASQLLRLLFSAIAAVLTFVLAARTGMIALWYLRTSSDDKVSAYQAVILSNANTVYCYSREVMNLVAFVFELVSHDALLSRPGFAGSIVEYGGNWAVQRWARKRYRIDPARGSDLRWPPMSALAEAVDVAFISAAARLAEPDRPVRIWRGRLAERASAEADPQSTLTNIDAIDRVTQRAVGRQLVGEISNVLPAELRLPLLGLLAAGTHLRELAWQAENASRGHGSGRLPSDLEALPLVGGPPNAGRSGVPPTLRQEGQEGMELPSRGDERPATPGSSAAWSHLDLPTQLSDPAVDIQASVHAEDLPHADDFTNIVGLGWDHSCQSAPDVLIGSLNGKGLLPTSPLQSRAHIYIHGRPYTPQLGQGTGQATPNNPAGLGATLIPGRGLESHAPVAAGHRRFRGGYGKNIDTAIDQGCDVCDADRGCQRLWTLVVFQVRAWQSPPRKSSRKLVRASGSTG